MIAEPEIEIKVTAEPSRRVIAITGIPGAGKTTLAAGIEEAKGWPLLSTGDIARRVDPSSLAAGGMADEEAFRIAFQQVMDAMVWDTPVILDGIPRSRGQVDLLPYFTTIIGLTCRPDVARSRLLRRGRSDDTEEIIDRRIKEQTELLDVEHADGWLYQIAGWGHVVRTDMKSREEVLAGVLDLLDGKKKQAF